MESHLRAGLAIYNAGEFHAAHDAWEASWLDLEQGTDDEQFLHGLIQFTAAVYHASQRNWAGATGLAESAVSYLDGLGTRYRGVNLAPIRSSLDHLGRDPEYIERRSPVRVTYEGRVLTLEALSFEDAAIAASVLAEEHDYDESLIEQAITYAETDLDAGRETSEFITLVFDFVRNAEARGVVFQRLTEHVKRRRQRTTDVEGLFE